MVSSSSSSSSSPFAKLPREIIAIISSYFVRPISLEFKKDILSFLRMNEMIDETPVENREHLYKKVLFWMNIQRILNTEKELNDVQQINILLFASNRPKAWENPVYKRHFYSSHGMKDFSKKFFYYINNNSYTHLGERPQYSATKYENKIRTIWGLLTVKERLQFLMILPFFTGVDTTHQAALV
jgi:hypothetical protein